MEHLQIRKILVPLQIITTDFEINNLLSIIDTRINNGKANIYTSNIDVTCKSVYFEHLIYVGGVSINASDTVSINGLKSETLNINSSARNIKMGSLIELTGSDDLIIDYDNIR